jgi:hypothetical protein
VNNTFFKAILVVGSLSFMGHLASKPIVQQSVVAPL